MKKRLVTYLLVSALAAAVFAGCSKKDGGDAADAAATDAAVVEEAAEAATASLEDVAAAAEAADAEEAGNVADTTVAAEVADAEVEAAADDATMHLLQSLSMKKSRKMQTRRKLKKPRSLLLSPEPHTPFVSAEISILLPKRLLPTLCTMQIPVTT